MSTLLITTLGGARRDEERLGHKTARYRLPGGERIVETANLGIELAKALHADKVCFVGTTAGFFDRLADLLPAGAASAAVEEHLELSARHEEANEAVAPEPEAPQAELEAEEPESDAEESESPAVDAPAAEASADAAPAADAALAPAEGAAVEAPPVVAEAAPAAAPAPQVFKRQHVADRRPLTERLLQQALTGRPDAAALDALASRLAEHLKMKSVRCVLISDPTSPRATLHALNTLSRLPEEGDRVHLDVSFGPRSLPVAAFLAMQYLERFRPDVEVGHVFMASPEHADDQGIVPLSGMDGPNEMLHWMGQFEALLEGRAPQGLHRAFVRDRWLNRLAGPYVRFQRGQRFGALSEVIEGARLVEEKRASLRRLPATHPFRLFNSVLAAAMEPFTSDAPVSTKQYIVAVQALQQGNLPLAALHLRDTLLSACLEAYGRDVGITWMDVPGSGGAQQVRPREVASFILSTPALAAEMPPLDIVWPLIALARNRYVNTSPSAVRAGQLKDEDHEVARAIEMVGSLIRSKAFAKLPELFAFEAAVHQSIDLGAIRPRDSFDNRRGGGGRGPRNERGRRPDRRGPRDGGRREGGPPEGANPPVEGAPVEGGAAPAQGAQGGDAPRQGREGGPREGGNFRGERGPRGPRRERGDGPRGDGPPRGDRPREGGNFRGERGPRPDRGPRPEGGPRRDRPRRDDNMPEDTTPRVTRSPGLGNLGLALAQAGLVSSPRRPEREEPKPTPPADVVPPQERAPEAPPQSSGNDFPVAGP